MSFGGPGSREHALTATDISPRQPIHLFAKRNSLPFSPETPPSLGMGSPFYTQKIDTRKSQFDEGRPSMRACIFVGAFKKFQPLAGFTGFKNRLGAEFCGSHIAM
ncbi:hypothetical protein CIHG_08260 [Coccidioides immitis H538.4]|uniref:Uncharacterized protein n=1 Tax=Coccidioides immitis H538.4 TaxID=396776 RepID=A0A0J8RZC7_COCIT|nr:hypothetical protein CIHG_08260 [Coccidioides immitis H538.4]